MFQINKQTIQNKAIAILLQITPIITVLSFVLGLMEGRSLIPLAILSTPFLMYLSFSSSAKVRIISGFEGLDERELLIKDKVIGTSSKIFFISTIFIINIAYVLAYYGWLNGRGLDGLNFSGQNSIVLILLLLITYFYYFLLPWSVALWTEEETEINPTDRQKNLVARKILKLSSGFLILMMIYFGVFVILGRQSNKVTRTYSDRLIQAFSVSGISKVTIIEDTSVTETSVEIRTSSWHIQASGIGLTDYTAYGPQDGRNQLDSDTKELSLGLSTASTINHAVFGEFEATITTPKVTAVSAFFNTEIELKSAEGCSKELVLRLFAQTGGKIKVDCFEGDNLNIIEYRDQPDQSLININRTSDSVKLSSYLEQRN